MKRRRLAFETLEDRQLLAALFFTKDGGGGNDQLLSVDQLTRGGALTNLNTQPGYLQTDTGETGLNPRVIDAGSVSGLPVVAVGGDLVHSFDASDISNRIGSAWDPDGGGNAGTDALAIGDFGTLSGRIVIARETSAGANDVLVMSTDALSPGSGVTVAGGPTGGGTAHGLVLADFQTANTGNEALIGFTNPAVPGGNGHQLFYRTAGNAGQFFQNTPISDVAAGDLNGSGNVDYVLTGLNNVGQMGFGQGSLVFEANGGSGTFLNAPGSAGPHNPPSFHAVAIGNLDSDADNELVLAGDDFVRVLDNNASGCFDCQAQIFQSAAALGGAAFVDVAVVDADDDGVNEVVAVADNGFVYMFGRSVLGDPNSPFSLGPLGVYDTGSGALLGTAALGESAQPVAPGFVAGRQLFYNNSAFDGFDPAANAADDAAVAVDKQALLPAATGSFGNYSSFVHGVNGLFVDIMNLADAGSLSASDFEFRVGNEGDPVPWNLGPAPINNVSTDVRQGAGVGGSDRVTLIWPDGAIVNGWLEVRVKATASTGLIFDDVFYVGSAVGETGDSATDALVTQADVDAAAANPHGPFNPASISDAYDFNRDQLVNAVDVVIARDNMTDVGTRLGLISAQLPIVAPFRIVEENGRWFRLEEPGGDAWNFDYFEDAANGIDAALHLNNDDSPLDVYFADEPGGMRLYLWEDGRPVPDLPHTGIKPTVGISGDLLAGGLYAIERNPMTHFLRQEASLSANSTTTLFAAQGFDTDVNGGAGIVLHPDHHQDTATWPGDPVDHPQSGALKLIAYGQGAGPEANAIVLRTRDGANSVADRLLVKDGTVTVFGDLVATGTITSGAARDAMQNLSKLSYTEAVGLLHELSAVAFAYTANPAQPRLGFIAEDVPKPFGTSNRDGVDPMSITAVLATVLQNQHEQIDQLSEQITAQQKDPPVLRSLFPSHEPMSPTLREVVDEATSPRVRTRGATGSGQSTGLVASSATRGSSSADEGLVASSTTTPVTPFQINEVANQWIDLQAPNARWNFDHFRNPAMGITSALSLNIDGSPLDFYLTADATGSRMYLWEDGLPVPALPDTGDQPDFGIWGDILVGDILGQGRDAISHFLRTETDLSASSGTVLFSANQGINNDSNGGAGIVMRPDHHQDLGVWPGDPVNHNESGALLLNAYGQGAGPEANAIVLQTRGGPNTLTDRVLIKDGTVRVFGDVVATGSITPGSSREFKQSIETLAYRRAADLVHQLQAVGFERTTTPGQPRFGFVGDELPHEFGTADGGRADLMSIVAALTTVAQQQQEEIDKLTAVVDEATSPLLAVPGASWSGFGDSLPRPLHRAASSFGASAGLPTVSPFEILASANQWLRLQESGGVGWNFTHVANAGLGLDSALSINVDGSARDLYFADAANGSGLYLWDDGLAVPNLPHTGAKPTLAVSGDLLVGDLITIDRDARTMFMREQQSLSASAATLLFSSRNGFGNDVDGGSAIILHPDHHQDTASFPGDPSDHPHSGTLELIAYGQGNGTYANSIVFRTRSGINALGDRLLVRDGTTTVFGDLEATGTITPGSSRSLKQDIRNVAYGEASKLLASLNAVGFVYNNDLGQQRLGFIAEEVPTEFGTVDRRGVDPMGIVTTLTVVVQQQQAQLERLSALLEQPAVSTFNPAAIDLGGLAGRTSLGPFVESPAAERHSEKIAVVDEATSPVTAPSEGIRSLVHYKSLENVRQKSATALPAPPGVDQLFADEFDSNWDDWQELLR